MGKDDSSNVGIFRLGETLMNTLYQVAVVSSEKSDLKIWPIYSDDKSNKFFYAGYNETYVAYSFPPHPTVNIQINEIKADSFVVTGDVTIKFGGWDKSSSVKNTYI